MIGKKALHEMSIAAASLLLIVAASLTAQDPVPSNYAELYQQLQDSLNGFEASLNASLPPEPRHVAFATELIAADANRGEALLQPWTMDTVRLCLDRFQEMGISGVTVAIHYPLFDPAFPRRDEYVAFYQSVAQEVHSRGMALCVENYVILTGTPFTPIQWDWSGYTVDSLATACHAMAQDILDQVKPDYLDVGTESDTEANATGLASLQTPQVFAGFIHGIVQGLNRGGAKLCAGMGAWDDIQQGTFLAQEPALDALAFHLYPLNPSSLQNAISLGEIARSSSKALIMDECWLYKEPPSGSVVSSADPYRRNNYSFWAPLDQQFLRCMAKLAQVEGVDFVSPFSSNCFFEYLTYAPALDTMPLDQVLSQANQAQVQALQADTRTSTGDSYVALIAQYPGSLTADFTVSPEAPTDATPVAFVAEASGGMAPYIYSWDLCGYAANGVSVMRALAAGSCEVTLVVTDASGVTATAKKAVQVGYSVVVSGCAWLANPGRLEVAGSGFVSGCAVKINSALTPRTVFKNSALLVVKGSALKNMVPKGVQVQIVVEDPDGRSSAPYPYER